MGALPDISILDALEDRTLFAAQFIGPNWAPWRIALRALFGLATPDAVGVSLYTECTRRAAWPSKPAREGWFVVGRRGGKSRVAALCAVFLACFRGYAAVLAPGEWATVLVIASDRPQSRVVFRYIKALISSVPMLERMVISEKVESIELQDRVRIEVATCSFRATRGYTIAACVCDEIAYWRSEDSANPDTEVLNAVRPGMATIPGSLLLCISSPYARRGAMWNTYAKHFGKDSPNLIWQAATRVMNATISQEVIEDALLADPESARAEYLAEFRSDLESFVNADALRACVATGCFERAPVSNLRYFGFVDPSGGSSDSMALAIAHLEHERAILDLIREVRPPFSPESVTGEFSDVLKKYRISSAHGDRYGAEWVREQFAKHGIQLQASEDNRSELYLRFLPAINSQQVEFLDHPRMLQPFETLERRTGRGTGKDSVDHPSGMHDDVSNAAAGALCLALREQGGRWGWAVQMAREWIEAGRPASETLPPPFVRHAKSAADVAKELGDAQMAASGHPIFGAEKRRWGPPGCTYNPVKKVELTPCPSCQAPLAIYGESWRCNACGMAGEGSDRPAPVQTT